MSKAQMVSKLLQIAEQLDDCGEKGGKDLATELRDIAHELADEV